MFETKTPYTYVSDASTNARNVVATGCHVRRLTVINTTGTIYYLKLFDKATAPTVGTDTPVQNFPIPANILGAGISIEVDAGFAKGLGMALTGGIALLDNSVAAAGVAINFTVGT